MVVAPTATAVTAITANVNGTLNLNGNNQVVNALASTNFTLLAAAAP